MISIRNLSKYYTVQQRPIKALCDINLEIAPREIFGIIGPSGAGKSTLIRCVNRLEESSSGTITIDGECLTTMPPHKLQHARRNIGMIFQHFNLLQSRNVAQNIALPLELSGKSPSVIEQRVNELLALTDLQAHAKQHPSQLSGGQKQRVAIARALANAPRILLCDEATSSLDPRSTLSILTLLKNIHQELGITILLITHEMDVIKTLCDRVAVIEHGKIVEQRTVLDLFTDPHSPAGKDLVNASSRMELSPALKALLQEKPSHETGTVLRIAYKGASASQPIISQLIQQYHVSVNILQGFIESIQHQTVGVMIVELKGNEEAIAKSIAFLKDNDLHIDILGYV